MNAMGCHSVGRAGNKSDPGCLASAHKGGRVVLNGVNSTAGLLLSYLTLRWVMGILAVSLPIVLIIWGFYIHGWWKLEDSISAYYYLRTRDVLVGVLFAIAWFLITYRGYDRAEKVTLRTLWRNPLSDNWAGYLAGGFALGVAFFPVNGGPLELVVHHVSAAGLFLLLAYFCLVLFTKKGPDPSPEKLRRNRVYRICGWIILACIVLMAVYSWFLPEDWAEEIKPVFWLESIALWAFGISWFIKGETLWKDERKWWKLFGRSSGKMADQSAVNQGTVDAL